MIPTERLRAAIDQEFPGMGADVLVMAQAMFEAENGADAYANASEERRAHYRFLAHAGLLALRAASAGNELVERLRAVQASLPAGGYGQSVLEDAISALSTIRLQAREEAANGWRPIETAPTDQSAVLVYIPEPISEKYRCVTGYCGIMATGSRMWVVDGKFAFDIGAPSHWKPLPDPPAAIRALAQEKTNA